MARVRIGRIALVGGLVELVGLMVNAGVSLAADRTLSLPAWLATPAAVTVAGMVTAALDATSHPGPVGPDAEPTAPARRKGVPLLAAATAILLVFGAGGYAAFVGSRYAIAYFSGNETGPNRLAASASSSGHHLRLTVSRVESTPHYTRVHLSVHNSGARSAELPLFENCVFTARGETLHASPDRSSWTEGVPPASTQEGIVTFYGHVPKTSTTEAQLSFLIVFGEESAGALVVKHIHLKALA